MSFGPGALNASAVWVGTTPATAVYLGTEKVWPIFVPQQSPWYSPGAAYGAVGYTGIEVPWPAGAEFCDAICLGGGAGGTGTGIGGNSQKGGGQGRWYGQTFPRVSGSLTFDKVYIEVRASPSNDGAGGGNFNTEAAHGSPTVARPYQGSTVGPFASDTGASQPMSSNTNNRNGGNVAEFVFNGRTYTMASYGTNAGRGGATSNKNGGDGTRPGGGGQSADNGGLTGYSGGRGAHGAAILYWY